MLTQSEDMLPYMESVVVWYHYIDDILLVWDGHLERLQSFLQKLNNNVFNLNVHRDF